MRLYPAAPRPFRATVAVDLLVVALLLLFAKLGYEVHGAVDDLAALGRGVESAGGSVRDAFARAADGVESVPLAGGELAEQLRLAGEGATGDAVATGRAAQERVHELARTVGWLTFAVPSLLVLLQYLPGRVGKVRRLTAAARALEPAHPRLLAMRAAFSLPYPVLLRHTPDPFGDLEREHYDALVRAALEDAGLVSRGNR
jgi:hypothetical protein